MKGDWRRERGRSQEIERGEIEETRYLNEGRDLTENEGISERKEGGENECERKRSSELLSCIQRDPLL